MPGVSRGADEPNSGQRFVCHRRKLPRGWKEGIGGYASLQDQDSRKVER